VTSLQVCLNQINRPNALEVTSLQVCLNQINRPNALEVTSLQVCLNQINRPNALEVTSLQVCLNLSESNVNFHSRYPCLRFVLYRSEVRLVSRDMIGHLSARGKASTVG
jgi:hypothetical protein